MYIMDLVEQLGNAEVKKQTEAITQLLTTIRTLDAEPLHELCCKLRDNSMTIIGEHVMNGNDEATQLLLKVAKHASIEFLHPLVPNGVLEYLVKQLYKQKMTKKQVSTRMELVCRLCLFKNTFMSEEECIAKINDLNKIPYITHIIIKHPDPFGYVMIINAAMSPVIRDEMRKNTNVINLMVNAMNKPNDSYAEFSLVGSLPFVDMPEFYEQLTDAAKENINMAFSPSSLCGGIFKWKWVPTPEEWKGPINIREPVFIVKSLTTLFNQQYFKDCCKPETKAAIIQSLTTIVSVDGVPPLFIDYVQECLNALNQ